jgi:ABC-2 type transport system permease protein
VIVAIRLLRDRRRSTLWWALGLVALVLFTVSLYPSVRGQASFDELIANLPEGVKVVIGYQAGLPLTSAPGYLQGRLFSTLAPVVMVVFGIGAGARAIGGSEEAGRLEPLLANPVSRTRVLFERYLATVALLFVLAAVFTAALLTLSAPVGALEGVSIAGLVGACAGVFGLALLHGTLAFAVGAATGRRTTATAVATTVAVAGYLVQSLLALTDVLRPLRFLTPWHWYLERNMLVDGPAPGAVVIPILGSVLLLLIGWAVFVRRDLR